MKIIYTSPEDFLRQEIDEHGYDYVDLQFALGFEPGLVTALGQSFYTWVKVQNVLQIQSMETDTTRNHRVSSSLPNHSVHMVGHLS